MFTVHIAIDDNCIEFTSDSKTAIEDFVHKHYNIEADIWVSTNLNGVKFGADWADRFMFGW